MTSTTQSRRDFLRITFADFLVRAAYQMGKTPLLPLYAAALGATDAFLGFIVSVSTLTGMVLKPGIGMLSDRWGRRTWLIVGTMFFAFVPFLYRFVQTPQQLFLIRILHGTATAIYGPVTVAYVAEQTQHHRAERLGWFGMARSGGYIVGPAVAGWLLLFMDPASVFTIIGLMSCAAFVPIFLLSEPPLPAPTERVPIRRQITQALKAGAQTPALWLSGGLESVTYIALYAMKTFLPIYALTQGFNVAVVGTFFAVQEGVHMVVRPFGGRMGDRLGHATAISLGMAGLGVMLPLLGVVQGTVGLMALAVLLGVGQALVFPSTVALVSTQIQQGHVGAGIGLVGTLQNAGKVAGPVIGGILLTWLDYSLMFRAMGALLVLGAALVWIWSRRRPRPRIQMPQLSGD